MMKTLLRALCFLIALPLAVAAAGDGMTLETFSRQLSDLFEARNLVDAGALISEHRELAAELTDALLAKAEGSDDAPESLTAAQAVALLFEEAFGDDSLSRKVSAAMGVEKLDPGMLESLEAGRLMDEGAEAYKAAEASGGEESLNDAMASWEKAKRIYLKMSDMWRASLASYNLGLAQLKHGSPEAALPNLSEAAELMRNAEGAEGEGLLAEALAGAGSAARETGRLDEAARYFEESASIFERKSETQRTAELKTITAEILGEAGNSVRAAEMNESLADGYRASGDLKSAADRLSAASRLYEEAGAEAKAIGAEEKGLALRVELDQKAEAGESATRLAGMLRRAGRREEAVKRFEEASGWRLAVGDKEAGAKALAAMGRLLRELERYEGAAAALKEARWLMEGLGDKAGAAALCADLGFSLYKTGKAEDALESFLAAASEGAEGATAGSRAWSLGMAGRIQRELGRAGESEASLRAALEAAQNAGDAMLPANLKNDLAATLHERGQLDEAIELLQAASQEYEKEHAANEAAAALLNLGVAMNAAGRFEEAGAQLRRAVDAASSLGDAALEMKSRRSLGLALWREGSLEEARSQYEAVVDMMEKGGGAASTAWGVEPFAWTGPWKDLIKLHLQMEDPQAALGVYERMKSRQAAEAMGGAGQVGTPLGGAEAVKAPGEGAAAVVWLVDEKKSYGIAISGGALNAFSIDLGEAELNVAIGAMTRAMQNGGEGLDGPARQLYDGLFGSVEGLLRSNERLIVVPDGPLLHLPFGALMRPDGGFVLERWAVSIAPSLTAYARMKQMKKEAPARVMVADPYESLGGDVAPAATLTEEELTGAGAAVPQKGIVHARICFGYGKGGDSGPLVEGWMKWTRVDRSAALPLASALVFGGLCAKRAAPSEKDWLGYVYGLLGAGAAGIVEPTEGAAAFSRGPLPGAFARHYRDGEAAADAWRDAALDLLRSGGKAAVADWAGGRFIGSFE